MLYSNTLKPYHGELSSGIQTAIQEISHYFGIIDPKVMLLDEWHVAIPVTFKVSIPSMGTVNSIDIRVEEPMMISLSLIKYPHIAPVILSDRMDFPKARLSHLYFTPVDKPAKLCLVRNSLHEWFSTIKMSDFLDVGGLWLYKAATGQLDDDGGEFDPTRLEGNVFFKHHHVYRYDVLNEVVVNDIRFVSEIPLALFGGGQLLKDGKMSDYQTNVHIPFIAFESVRDAMKTIQEKGVNSVANPIFTLVFWDANGTVEDQYLTIRPENFGQLKEFFKQRGIFLRDALKKLEQHGALLRRGLPIIFAVKRPRKVIGYNGEYEFINFHLTIPENGVAGIDDNTEVLIQGHIEPLSKVMAQYLSKSDEKPASLYIGAGSLGSKLILHDGRSGNLSVGICDNDKMFPHNQARHELFAGHVGEYKAEAIAAEIKKFYPADNTDNIVSYKTSAIFLDREFEKYERLIDTTASVQVMNYMLSKALPTNTRYYKAEIADEGALGLFYAEGYNRNPRMDDLVNLAHYNATKNESLRIWRMNDSAREMTSINVGLGCSSTTSVIADDCLSLHGGIFSRILSMPNGKVEPGMPGLLALSILDESKGFPNVCTEYFEVQAFDVLKCQEASGWEVRLMEGISKKLFSSCNSRSPKETGGVMIGIANYKTKVIHVFDIITEPQGSFGTTSRFLRGTKGLPSEIDKIKKLTGDVVGYIGEWHSHPMNLKTLSTTDRETIAQLQILNRKVPIPTCALIVTPDEILVFVQE